MDIVTIIKDISTVVYVDYTGKKVKNEFQCLDCGCSVLYRHKRDYGLSYWEGSFVCRGCKKEINYYSDDWKQQIIKEPRQLAFFE